jgi:hypothetical protein
VGPGAEPTAQVQLLTPESGSIPATLAGVSLLVWGVAAVMFACLCVLAVMVLGLIRQLKALSAAMTSFQEAIQPTLDAIQTDGQRAQERLQGLPGGREGLLELAQERSNARAGATETAG